jgi:ankyrin repeat protein
LATRPGSPRNWQPASYLAFSRFLKHQPKRQADFLKSMKIFLNAGVDVNTSWLEKPDDPKSQKESLLYGAAGVANNTAMTKLLLKAGADPNDGESLYHACEFKNNDILKLLYDAGVTPESWSYCLLRKLDYEDFDGVKFMLGRGIDPNHLHPGTGKAAMHWAIMRRRGLKFIKVIHAAGGDPNLKDKEGFTPYTLATRLDRSDVADYLLKHGAIDDRDAAAKLIDAAVAGDMKTVRALLKQSPTILKSPTPAQLQALPGAAAAGNLAGVKALLDLGWPIDTRGDWGGSALHHAAWNDHPAVVKLLLKRGARIDVRQQWDGDALHTALHAIQTEPRIHAAEIVRALVKSGQINDLRKYVPEDPDQPGADKVIKVLTPYLPKHSDDPAVKALPPHRKGHKIAQWKPIMDAAYTGDAERIKKLLKEGADPNIVSTTPARYRPLHRAIERKKSFKRGPKDIAAVKALLEGGADPKLLGMWGRHTALGMAASYEPMFVPVLIDYFKPLDIIHAAAVADEDRVAELLKKDKKLATARDEGDWTPLHYAAASRMHELGPEWSAKLVNIAKMLLRAGADVMAAWNYNDEWPLRPLYYAAGWSNHPAMAELLLQNGADACDNESTYHAADENYVGCLAMIEKYTPAKKLAKECTSCLPTQLHWGATRGAKWLLEHGADPNFISPRYGKTALQIASEGGASEGVISLLMQHGGDPKLKNDKGQSAIDLAKAAGKTRVVEQLRKA